MGCGTSKMTLHESRQLHQNSSGGIRPMIQRRLDEIKRLASPTVTRLHTITSTKEVLAPEVIDREEDDEVHTYYSASSTSRNGHRSPRHGRKNKDRKGSLNLCDEKGKDMMKMEESVVQGREEIIVEQEVKKGTNLIRVADDDAKKQFEVGEEVECYSGSEEEEEDRREDSIWQSLGSPSFRVYCMDSGPLCPSTTGSCDFDEEVEQVQFHYRGTSNYDELGIERNVCEGSFDEPSCPNKGLKKKKLSHKGVRRRLRTFTTLGGIRHLNGGYAPRHQNYHQLQKSATVS